MRCARATAFFLTAAVMLLATSPLPAQPARKRVQSAPDPAAEVEAWAAQAEAALRLGEVQIAESRYREALVRGWMIVGALDAAEGRLTDAREAYRRASTSAVASDGPRRALAMMLLQTGEHAEALGMLARLVTIAPRDSSLRRLYAQALATAGKPEQAVRELEEALGALPDDLELTFALASGYVRVKRVEDADKLFAKIAAAKPIPRTYVLIGRTYRDYGEYARARAALRRALELDPRVTRAHYYLGTITIMEEGYVRVDEAISEFKAELKVAPRDPVTHLRLGIVLTEAKRHDEALPSLEIAARDPNAGTEALEYLGRCQVALGRHAEAAETLTRALKTIPEAKQNESRTGRLHYQLGVALRALGRSEEAAREFASAQRSAEGRTESARARLETYLADAPDAEDPSAQIATLNPPGSSDVAALSSADRTAIRRRVTGAMARAYLNLGIVHAHAERFSRAAGFFELAAAADPEFPQVQYSLGVAYFNSRQFKKATEPLARALADANRADARRMLALCWLNLDAYDKAAELLESDPQRQTDPSLQYAYGLALVRTGRAEEAQAIFSRLLAQHGDSPEINVVLGQAYAQQGHMDQAVASLKRAVAAKPDVRDANTTLGIIYLKQGKLAEAEAALEAALAARKDDVQARHALAAALELLGRREEAVGHLRAVIRMKPDMSDARYLLGKILLSLGQGEAAAGELESAARLAPEDANIHYQLSQAYRKNGQTELADRAFERYRQLKDKKREGSQR
jgi:tetratricopeptide (TPR) repeat protein